MQTVEPSERVSKRGVSGNSPSTHFSPDRQPVTRRGKSDQTLIREAIEAETGKDMPAFWRSLVKKALGDEGAPYMKMLMDRLTPTLKSHMLTVTIDHFPADGSATEQAESVLKAVAQGVLPLDYAGPMLAMIQLIDTAKGGSLGNSGLDLSALYAGTSDGMAAAANFAKQIAATTKPEGASRNSDSLDINAAIDAEATSILTAIGGEITDEAHAQALLDSSTNALAVRFPSNTYDSIKAALVKVLNARLLEGNP